MSTSAFSRIAAEVHNNISRKTTISAVDKNAEWQRVNSYIADTLKDSAMLYSKLARLQGDFVGEELDRLKQISEVVLNINNELSSFSEAFNEGKLDMAESEYQYGQQPGQQPGGEMFQPFENNEGGGETAPELPEELDMGGEEEGSEEGDEEDYDEEPEEKPESEQEE
jgi:hypothetical protein